MSPAQSWGDLLKDAGDSGKAFEPLEDSSYDFVIAKAEAGQTKTDKKKFTITAEVENGPFAKRKVWHDFIISPDSPAALGFFFRNMAVLGLDGAFFAANPNDEQIVAALTGKRFIGKTVKNEWPANSGKIRNNIDNFSTPRQSNGPSGVGPVASAPLAKAPVAPVAPAPVAPAPAPVAAAAPAAPAVPHVPVPAAGTVDPWADATGQAAAPAFAPPVEPVAAAPAPVAPAPVAAPVAPAPAPAPAAQDAPPPPPF